MTTSPAGGSRSAAAWMIGARVGGAWHGATLAQRPLACQQPLHMCRLRTGMPTERRYSGAEARAILERAERRSQSLASRDADQLLSSVEVIETARELGIDAEQAALALREHENDREIVQAETELRQLAFRRLSGHAIAFAFTQGMIALFGLWSAAQRPLWLLAMSVVWLAGLALALRAALFPHPDTLREAGQGSHSASAAARKYARLQPNRAGGAAKLLSVSARSSTKGSSA